MTSTTLAPPASTTAVGRRHDPVRTVIRLTAVELRLLLREPGTMVGLVGFPIATVLVLAGVFGSVPDPEFGGAVPSEHYVIGYLGVVLASMGLLTLPTHIATQRELGVLRRYRASGLSGGTLVASHIGLGTVLGTLAGLLVLAVGAGVYGVPVPENPLGVIGWFIAGLACFIAVGGALGTAMPNSRAAGAIGNLIFVPTFLLGGGGPPSDVVTGPMQTISDVLPLSHVIGGLRQSWLGATDDPHALWVPLVTAALAILIAMRTARRATF